MNFDFLKKHRTRIGAAAAVVTIAGGTALALTSSATADIAPSDLKPSTATALDTDRTPWSPWTGEPSATPEPGTAKPTVTPTRPSTTTKPSSPACKNRVSRAGLVACPPVPQPSTTFSLKPCRAYPDSVHPRLAACWPCDNFRALESQAYTTERVRACAPCKKYVRGTAEELRPGIVGCGWKPAPVPTGTRVPYPGLPTTCTPEIPGGVVRMPVSCKY